VTAGVSLEVAQTGATTPAGSARVLTTDALSFVAQLHQQFEPRRMELLRLRDERQAA
jgi:malate synthase